MQKNNNTLMLLAPTVPSVSSLMGISPGKRVNRSNVFSLNRRFSDFLVSYVYNRTQRHEGTKGYARIEDTKLAFQDFLSFFGGLLLCAFVSLC